MNIVVNVGCLECGIPSNIMGVFSDKARAPTHRWRNDGHNRYLVFPMPEVDTVTTEYQEFLS